MAPNKSGLMIFCKQKKQFERKKKYGLDSGVYIFATDFFILKKYKIHLNAQKTMRFIQLQFN